MIIPTRPLVAGREVDPAARRRLPLLDPSTGESLAEVAQAGSYEVEAAVAAARQAFDRGPWPRLEPFERGRVLAGVAARIREDAAAIAELEARNGGKPISAARAEVTGAAKVFDYYAGAADKHFGETIPLGDGLLDFTLRQPVGVAALIVPWNFPFLAAAWKLAPSLAVGCTTILKPASVTPLSALVLGRLASEAGLPEGVLSVLPGPGQEVGEQLVRDPRVDKVAFTGDTVTGSRVAALAAATIKRVSLELGGKSPNIVFADADVDLAARSAVKAAFGNAGQSCSARSRILVERSVVRRFTEAFVEATRALRIGAPLDEATELGPLISASHWGTVSGYVKAALDDGARLLLGGNRPLGFERGNYFAPTILAGLDNSSRAAQEEIFGPVACLISFDGEAEALDLANDTVYGLNASVWTRDLDRALRVSSRLRTGMVSVNTHGSASRHGVFAPFGGMKRSGLGRELGMYALDLYTEVKNVLVSISAPSP